VLANFISGHNLIPLLTGRGRRCDNDEQRIRRAGDTFRNLPMNSSASDRLQSKTHEIP
jgi:hypothetical protein